MQEKNQSKYLQNKQKKRENERRNNKRKLVKVSCKIYWYKMKYYKDEIEKISQ
jgi:hypothetical protein